MVSIEADDWEENIDGHPADLQLPVTHASANIDL